MNQGGLMFKILLLLMCLGFLASCGSGDTSRSVSSTNEFSDDFDEEFDEESDEESDEDSDDGDEFAETEEESTTVGLNLDEEIEYTVEKNDTLMMISFKFYGDYAKWRSIQEMNPDVGSILTVGQVIKLPKPEEAFVWSPSGEPYVIQKGDTLGSISQDKYGTKSKWRKIYENNKPLIKDPNLIFAGFTLYYEANDEEVVTSI